MLLEYKGAYLRLTSIGGGVVSATYGGPMTTETFNVLRSRGIGLAYGYAAAVIDTRAIVPLGLDLHEVSQQRQLQRIAPPGAFAVCPSQYDLWADFAILGARLGYARAVFVTYQEAFEWARDMAACTLGSDSEPEHSMKKAQAACRDPLCDPAASQADEPSPTEPAPLL